MPTDLPTPPTPAQPLYTPPLLVVHGNVQTLTHKLGTSPDQDSAGSFNPPDTGDTAPSGQ